MRFRNLKIISIARSETGRGTSHNTDGFDPDNSSDILIENNFISVDDDAIAVKLKAGRRRDMRNIVFRNNVIWTMCAALKIGTEVHDHTIRDIRFENNDVVHADSGIVVQCYRNGYVNGASWLNNHFEQIGVIANDSPHRKGAQIYVNSRSRDGFGHIQNLVLKNNSFEREPAVPSMICAAGERQTVENVLIEDLRIEGRQRKTAVEAGIRIDRDAKQVEFR
jgi:polygalacturonase